MEQPESCCLAKYGDDKIRRKKSKSKASEKKDHLGDLSTVEWYKTEIKPE
jgi:hypothetical protein